MSGAKGVPTSLDGALAELAASSEAGDYAKSGFHHRHAAAAAQLPAIAGAFRERGYFLEMVTGEDRRFDSIGKLRLVYTFNQVDEADRHVVFVELDPGTGDGCEAPSVVDVYRAADWMEREVYDMYGVRFAGHPDLKRILLPDDADFHALLKDFGRIEDAEPTDNGDGGDGETEA